VSACLTAIDWQEMYFQKESNDKKELLDNLKSSVQDLKQVRP
jgi:hypothetical protein